MRITFEKIVRLVDDKRINYSNRPGLLDTFCRFPKISNLIIIFYILLLMTTGPRYVLKWITFYKNIKYEL